MPLGEIVSNVELVEPDSGLSVNVVRLSSQSLPDNNVGATTHTKSARVARQKAK